MLFPLIDVSLRLFDTLVWLYEIVIIAAVAVSWLVAFGVLNTYNQVARTVIRALDALTEPVFRQIRRIIPTLGGLDLSPLIALLILWVLQQLVDEYGQRALYSLNQ
jgi:YggT family protein